MSSKWKRKGSDKFVKLDGYLIRSPAWWSLTPVERAAYLEMRWAYDGHNNGRIGMGARTMAKAINVSRATAARALLVLQEKGFLVMEQQSGFHMKNRVAAEWRLTSELVDGRGGTATKEFTKWRPENSNNSLTSDQTWLSHETVRRKSAVHQG